MDKSLRLIAASGHATMIHSRHPIRLIAGPMRVPSLQTREGLENARSESPSPLTMAHYKTKPWFEKASDTKLQAPGLVGYSILAPKVPGCYHSQRLDKTWTGLADSSIG